MMARRDVSIGELRARLLEVLTAHVGRENAIGMGELYEEVYGRSWRNRINDTRALRVLVTDLRERGVRICSRIGRGEGGYYLASAKSEMKDYVERLKLQALRKLARAAELEKMSLPELLGQMQLNLKERGHDAA
jgi:hypothetical protein